MASVTATQSTGTNPAETLGSSAEKAAKDKQNQFLQLLVAQLKGQNPLNPMEGSEFVSQLAQFSSLQELTHMSGTLDNVQTLLAYQADPAGGTGTPNPFGNVSIKQ